MIVKDNLSIPNKSSIAHEILSYLADHPQAQDTSDGIVQWWLLDRKIKNQMINVKEVLAELVAKGLVLEYKRRDLQSHYRINQHKYEEIQSLLKRAPE